MSIATEVWFPVVTLIVGIVLNAYFNARTEARAMAREREARVEQRLDVIHQRRSEFQRATLIELQDAVQALGRCTGSATHELIMALNAGTPAQEMRLTRELNEALRVAYADVARLRVRVRDDQARRLAEGFSALSVTATMANDRSTLDTALAKMQVGMIELQERLGELIRTIDDRDDRLITTAERIGQPEG